MTMTRGRKFKSKDTAKAQELTEYEKKRLSNMAKIESRFQSLGIATIKNIMEATTTSNTTEKAREPNRKNNDDSDYDPKEDRGVEEDETTTMSTPTKLKYKRVCKRTPSRINNSDIDNMPPGGTRPHNPCIMRAVRS